MCIFYLESLRGLVSRPQSIGFEVRAGFAEVGVEMSVVEASAVVKAVSEAVKQKIKCKVLHIFSSW